jgi:hypothetical protein
VECNGRQSKNGGGYGGYTDGWMNGGSCGHELVITGADLAVLASLLPTSLLGAQYAGRRVNNTKICVVVNPNLCWRRLSVVYGPH